MDADMNLAQLFRNRSATYGNRIRWREKRNGVWQKATWAENQAIVNRLIVGLEALSARPGDVIGILSNTRWEWMAADWAILGLGAVTVTVYPSNTPATVAYILGNARARFIFAENREQFEKLASIRDQIPNVEKVILFEDAETVGDDPWVIALDAFQALSSRSAAEADAFAAGRAASIAPDDLATLVYTSGTTGQPKGVELLHSTLMAQISGVRTMMETIRPGDVDVLFLPLAHVFGREEHLAGHDRGLETVVVSSFDHLAEALRENRPNLLFSVPRVYEKAYAAIQAKAAAGSHTQQRIFNWATRVGIEAVTQQAAGQPLPAGLRMRYLLADRLVFKKVRAALGGKIKFSITAAAPLDKSIMEFFNAAGVLLLEGWGMTETSGGFTLNTVKNYRFGSIGRPYAGHELRIAADGEILVKGPCVTRGYHDNPEATAEAIDADGWLHTGDVGEIDADGYVYIRDRKKDLIITASGKNIAPQAVENALKSAPGVSQVAVYGDRKPYLVALVTLDPAAVKAWAAEQGIASDDITAVYNDPRFRAYLDAGLQHANQQLASYETVKYYEVLSEDFTVENDLLTPTLKIRRRQIHARYHDLYESLYQPSKAEAAY
ncbi:MAG TPA: long-chain fatty acid--CoA ligase [Ktedonobacterales bacterium]|nr:long-chain fatty acid--CoA ligase [Ktedonobacterales bacterium]